MNKSKETSSVWRHILNHRKLLTRGIHWIVGKIKFWFDNWVGNGLLINYVDPKLKENIDTQEKFTITFDKIKLGTLRCSLKVFAQIL